LGPTTDMDNSRILEELKYHTDRLPRKALRAAIDRREEITPALIDILEKACLNPEMLEDERYMAHIYAMFLLAQFRESRAYGPICSFFSLPGDISMDSTGDVVTEDLDRILASVCNGDLTLIKRLIENPEINGWVRGAAVGSLVILCFAGLLPRDEVISYYGFLFRGGLERNYSQAWNSLASCAAELHPAEIAEEIRLAYQDELIHPGYIEPEYFDRILQRQREDVLRESASRVGGLIGDTIQEMEWWACFKSEPAAIRRSSHAKKDFHVSQATPPGPPKAGRNQPCPCGSGKKYKKCCGR